jgi:DNA repair photolyase
MSQLKSPGNMYPWVGKTRNFISGKCPHECDYCYVPSLGKRFAHIRDRYSGTPFLLQGELRKSEGSGKMIFVQSCGDLFAEVIPDKWIEEVLEHCCHYRDNTYLIQSKNPERFLKFADRFPVHTILGTTIESNKDYNISKAPKIRSRVRGISLMREKGFDRMVSIEPVLDFDLDEFLIILMDIDPNFISIGADSKKHNLSEPSPEKIKLLVDELRKVTQVKLKSDLYRVMMTVHC